MDCSNIALRILMVITKPMIVVYSSFKTSIQYLCHKASSSDRQKDARNSYCIPIRVILWSLQNGLKTKQVYVQTYDFRTTTSKVL